MKSAPSIAKSAESRLRKASREAENMSRILKALDQGLLAPEGQMKKLREMHASLGQCLHEFNAYHNCLHTP